VGSLSGLPQPRPDRLPNSQVDVAYVLISEAPFADSPPDMESPWPKNVLQVQLPEGKRGQKQLLNTVLPRAAPFMDSYLSKGMAVCICCDDGKNASIGVALTALQLFFDGDGGFVGVEDRMAQGV
jgi:tRNA A64-2'-O-ribosylphosphate transferase